jgi:hypothetical protein
VHGRVHCRIPAPLNLALSGKFLNRVIHSPTLCHLHCPPATLDDDRGQCPVGRVSKSNRETQPSVHELYLHVDVHDSRGSSLRTSSSLNHRLSCWTTSVVVLLVVFCTRRFFNYSIVTTIVPSPPLSTHLCHRQIGSESPAPPTNSQLSSVVAGKLSH